MDLQISIRNLQFITALDSLSYGLVYGFISPYILELGGNHVSIGILGVSSLIGELLSSDVIKIFTHLHGRRYALFFILNTALVTNLLMVLTASYYFTILIRMLFSITNQSQSLCLELLLNKAQTNEEKAKFQKNYSILSGLGYIMGPIISGYLFNYGFGYIGVLSALLCFVNISLLMSVSKDNRDVNPEHTDVSVLEKALNRVEENINHFRLCDSRTHWDVICLKYLFSSSMLIFFSRFTQLLKHNYESSNIIIGYTRSYINILVFVATYCVAISKSTMEKYSLLLASEISFLVMGISMLLACYAPNLVIYMLLLIPIIFLQSLIVTLCKSLFEECKNNLLIKLNDSVGVVAGLTIPLLFGVLCDYIAHNAVILFSCLPMFLCWIIIKLYSKFIKVDRS